MLTSKLELLGMIFAFFFFSDEERRDEAFWICNQLDLGYNADQAMALKAVEHVLRFLGVESQEVPFIWHYRR